MIRKHSNQSKSVVFSEKSSKLRQKLGQLIKEKSQCMRIIFSNVSMVKGGVYILNRKCGKASCKCSTTDYRHASYYLYKTEEGKNNIIYLKQEEVAKMKKLTRNYIKYRQARAQLIKNEKSIMKVINEIEAERTIPFIREGKSEKKQIQKKSNEKK